MTARVLFANPHVNLTWAANQADAAFSRAALHLSIYRANRFPGAREVVRRVRAAEIDVRALRAGRGR